MRHGVGHTVSRTLLSTGGGSSSVALLATQVARYSTRPVREFVYRSATTSLGGDERTQVRPRLYPTTTSLNPIDTYYYYYLLLVTTVDRVITYLLS